MIIPREASLGKLGEHDVWMLTDDHTRFVRLVDKSGAVVEFDLDLLLEMTSQAPVVGAGP